MEIKLKSRWLQECICKFLNKEDDILYFTQLEALRFMDCCIEINKIDYLKNLKNLRILELGGVSLSRRLEESFKELFTLASFIIPA